nr:uncharacterized protein LOC128703774 [Cherax quadricarinatus]
MAAVQPELQEKLEQIHIAHAEASKELQSHILQFSTMIKIWGDEFQKELDQRYGIEKMKVIEDLQNPHKLQGPLIKGVLNTTVASLASGVGGKTITEMKILYIKGFQLARIIAEIYEERVRYQPRIRFRANHLQRFHLGTICSDVDQQELKIYQENLSCRNTDGQEETTQWLRKQSDTDLSLQTDQSEESKASSSSHHTGQCNEPRSSSPSLYTIHCKESKNLSPKTSLKPGQKFKDGVKKTIRLEHHGPLRRPLVAQLIEAEKQAYPEVENAQPENAANEMEEWNVDDSEMKICLDENENVTSQNVKIADVNYQPVSCSRMTCYPGTTISHFYKPGLYSIFSFHKIFNVQCCIIIWIASLTKKCCCVRPHGVTIKFRFKIQKFISLHSTQCVVYMQYNIVKHKESH